MRCEHFGSDFITRRALHSHRCYARCNQDLYGEAAQCLMSITTVSATPLCRGTELPLPFRTPNRGTIKQPAASVLACIHPFLCRCIVDIDLQHKNRNVTAAHYATTRSLPLQLYEPT